MGKQAQDFVAVASLVVGLVKLVEAADNEKNSNGGGGVYVIYCFVGVLVLCMGYLCCREKVFGNGFFLKKEKTRGCC